jgi:hypothetical protein
MEAPKKKTEMDLKFEKEREWRKEIDKLLEGKVESSSDHSNQINP